MLKSFNYKKNVLIPSATLLIVCACVGIGAVAFAPYTIVVREPIKPEIITTDTRASLLDSERFYAMERELEILRLQLELLAELPSIPLEKTMAPSSPTVEIEKDTTLDIFTVANREAARDAQLAVLNDVLTSGLSDVSASIDIEQHLMNASSLGDLVGIEHASATCVSDVCRLDLDFANGAQISPDEVISRLPFIGQVFATGNDEQATLFIARNGVSLPVP